MSRRSLMRNVSSLFKDMIQQLKTELEKIECLHYCRLLEYFPQIIYGFYSSLAEPNYIGTVYGANNEIDDSDYNTEMREIEYGEILRTVNITEILDGQIGQNINDMLDIKLLKHQKCAAHN
ncbi:Hypothetical protein CINCED_3A014650 [Cinara cedri]|uniref:Uncharacterized protein n=1 Tax=Cinara cedri TaxID=506608 RepID=A0A5E4M4I2_9HEMI|nr:Hypothetical protein CINCED_3A014650 [Cinara cedri]